MCDAGENDGDVSGSCGSLLFLARGSAVGSVNISDSASRRKISAGSFY